jgi:ABC-type phosphate/phosphonate transport system substrate-binding protein
MIVNARMYSPAPGAERAWRDLLAWVLARAKLDWPVIDYPAPLPLAELWARPDLGCAFMCGWPYSRAQAGYQLLAAPVPSPARYGGQAIYFTDLVVKADSPFRTLEDTFGGSLAYTIEDSQSGYNAVRHQLLAHRAATGKSPYRSIMGPLITPRCVLQAVAAGEADIGPLDSYVHDLLRRHEPEFAAQVRTVATTIAAPIPPLVAATGVASANIQGLRSALLEVADAAELADIRVALLLRGFALVEPQRYDVLEARAREAVAAGYPNL